MEKLRLIELCSGIGAQVKGIENTDLFEVESIATADLDKEVVVSYAAIHCGLTNEMIESYDSYPSKEEMIKTLTDKRLGYDFKNDKPCDWAKVSRRKDKTKGIEKYYLADKLSKNLGDMIKIDALPDCDMLTYSCPCQSLSISGHQDGLKWTCQDCGTEYDPASMSVAERYTCPNCGSHNIKSTRSGLLYEVERLLVKAKENGNLPKYLLMENVDALVSKKFVDSFNDWVERLDNLGYNSYYQVINAKNAGIPQNRKRIFVISILKEYDNGKFAFPAPFDNGIRLKDVLEDHVEERYYLSDDKVAKFLENFKVLDKKVTTRNSEIASCIRASYFKNGARNIEENIVNGNGYEGIVEPVTKNEVIQIGNIAEEKENFKNPQVGRIYSADGCSPTLNTCNGGSHEPKIMQVGSVSSSQDGIVVDPKGISKTLTAGHFNCPKVILGVDNSTNDPNIIERANCITTRENRGVSNHKGEGTAVIEMPDYSYCLDANYYKGSSPEQYVLKCRRQLIFENVPQYELNGYPLYPDKEGNVKAIVAMRGRYPENPSSRVSGLPTEQRLEVNENDTTNCLTSVQKDNLVLEGSLPIEDDDCKIMQLPRGFNKGAVLENCSTISSNSWEQNNFLLSGQDNQYRIRIRKLTPKECHRLMGFDDEDWNRCKEIGTSDSQGYHQAGNSIVTNVISLIAEHLYKALYDDSYECLDEKIVNFQNPQAD